MESFKELMSMSGSFWAYLGAALAFFLAGIGSARGVMFVGTAAAGVISEDPKKFVPSLIMEALPSTQGIYGFVIAFMIIGKASGSALSIGDGMILFMAALPVGIVGLLSAICQGKVAAASMGIVAKREKDWFKGVMLCLTVELFALFGFLVSIIMLLKVQG